MIANDLLVDDLNQVANVYIHSAPDYSEVYDIMWNNQHANQVENIETWGINRKSKLDQLIGSLAKNSITKDSVVLDLCSGLGRLSAAVLETGCQYVVLADASVSGLRNSRDKFLKLGLDEKKYCHVQLDAQYVAGCFKKGSFDVVLHYYALQHIPNYRSVIDGVFDILKQGGLFAFNFFTEGTTHYVTDELRKIFLGQKPSDINQFFDDIGFVRCSRVSAQKANLLDKLPLLQSKYQFVPDLLTLINEYGEDLVDSKLNFEDFTTPSIHNFSHAEIRDYCTGIGFRVVDESPGRIVAKK